MLTVAILASAIAQGAVPEHFSDRPGPHRSALLRLGRDSSHTSEDPCCQHAEEEPADVSEDCDAAAVRRGAEQPEVRLDQLVQEPRAEEDPGRDPDHEDGHDVREDREAGTA